MIDRTQKHARLEKERCGVCHSILPPEGIFCMHCAPPQEPEPIPDSSLSLSQTIFRITILIFIFIGFFSYKENLFVKTKAKEEIFPDTPIKTQDQTEAESFKVIHFVSADWANVRSEPSIKGSIVVILRRAEKVIVKDRNDYWSKIIIHDKQGWISNNLIDSKIE
tara:strand:+ start:35 stop:529 length:495 start_codon:yes stop_codon:yes gene_type:complete